MFNNNAVFLIDAEKNLIPFLDSKLVDYGFGDAYAKTVPHLPNCYNHFIIMRRAEPMAIKTEEFNIVY